MQFPVTCAVGRTHLDDFRYSPPPFTTYRPVRQVPAYTSRHFPSALICCIRFADVAWATRPFMQFVRQFTGRGQLQPDERYRLNHTTSYAHNGLFPFSWTLVRLLPTQTHHLANATQLDQFCWLRLPLYRTVPPCRFISTAHLCSPYTRVAQGYPHPGPDGCLAFAPRRHIPMTLPARPGRLYADTTHFAPAPTTPLDPHRRCPFVVLDGPWTSFLHSGLADVVVCQFMALPRCWNTMPGVRLVTLF